MRRELAALVAAADARDGRALREAGAAARLALAGAPRIGGLTDIAADHDVSRVSAWRWTKDPTFPGAVVTSARGALYDLDEVARWRSER